jgi:hypothetical protein
MLFGLVRTARLHRMITYVLIGILVVLPVSTSSKRGTTIHEALHMISLDTAGSMHYFVAVEFSVILILQRQQLSYHSRIQPLQGLPNVKLRARGRIGSLVEVPPCGPARRATGSYFLVPALL